MDLSRITTAMNVQQLSESCVAIFGAGGSAGLATNLARCGVGHFKLFDFDRVSPANVSRQHHDAVDVGRTKCQALADAIRRINPDVVVEVIEGNFLEIAPAILTAHVVAANLLIFATDRFAAQAKGNELALQHDKPAMWIGLYPGGTAGEIIFWHSEIDACFRCLCAKRYEAHAVAAKKRESLDPVSDGCTIFDITLLDAIAGMIGIGLMTRGSNDRFGRLIDKLGDRNFIQVQLDPSWSFGGGNPIRKYLGVADDCEAFFSWNAIVRADPDGGRECCCDCIQYRHHIFLDIHGIRIRTKPVDQAAELKSSLE